LFVVCFFVSLLVSCCYLFVCCIVFAHLHCFRLMQWVALGVAVVFVVVETMNAKTHSTRYWWRWMEWTRNQGNCFCVCDEILFLQHWVFYCITIEFVALLLLLLLLLLLCMCVCVCLCVCVCVCVCVCMFVPSLFLPLFLFFAQVVVVFPLFVISFHIVLIR
jgi:hypothetical protein